MEYQALYRQFRPEVFDDMVGQEHIVQALKNQIESGQVSHAYLFCGTRGTGKTSTARILSRAVNCENPKDANPCNECESCRSIMSGTDMDVVEIDAASNTSVENIRDIREEVMYPPTMLKYKVYIIDEVHMLSSGAFNALLKTLEEPPEHVIFILATTEYHKVPATILSRCQRFDFKRIASSDIKSRLKFVCDEKGVTVDDEALNVISYAADGSMRDSLAILDKCVSFSKGNITGEIVTKILGVADDNTLFEIADAISKNDLGTCLEKIEETIREGRDPILLTTYLIEHYRCLLIASLVKNPEEVLQMAKERADRFVAQAKSLSAGNITNIIKKLSSLYKVQKESPNPKVMLEAGIVTLNINDEPVKKSNAGYGYEAPVYTPPVYDYAPPVYEAPTVEEKPEHTEAVVNTPTPEVESTSGVDASKLTDLWIELIDTVARARKMQLSSAMKSAMPVEQNGMFIVMFEDDKKILKDMVNNADNIKYVKDLLKSITGNDYIVKFQLRSESSMGESAPKKVGTHSLEELAQKFPDIVTIEE